MIELTFENFSKDWMRVHEMQNMFCAKHNVLLSDCDENVKKVLIVTLQHTATHCNTLLAVIVLRCDRLDILTHCNTLQHTATHSCSHTATHCNTLRHTATHSCNALMLTHCNTLQHTATNSLQRLCCVMIG